MKTINFSTLSMQDALDLAILIEEEAAERYLELSQQMDSVHTGAAAEFFHSMVLNETKHRDDLRKRRRTIFADAPSRVDESMLWEIEAPAYDKVRAFMSAHAALRVALDSEEKAHRFFDEAIDHVTDGAVRALFMELRDEELEHQKLVRAQMALLPEESTADIEDYVDGPVAQ